MKEVFKIAEFNLQGELRLKTGDYETYQEAVNRINELPEGTYQVQKVFVKS